MAKILPNFSFQELLLLAIFFLQIFSNGHFFNFFNTASLAFFFLLPNLLETSSLGSSNSATLQLDLFLVLLYLLSQIFNRDLFLGSPSIFNLQSPMGPLSWTSLIFNVYSFAATQKLISARGKHIDFQVDWEGKVALIQCAKAMGIQKFIFFSIHNCEKHPEVPLMEIKRCTEKYLQESGLNYTVIRLCGFMQGLIGQYAVPILEDKAVWGTDAPTRIAYMDTQDIARMTFTALRNEKTNKTFLTFAGPRAWTSAEVISLCERLAGQDARVTTVPVGVLRFTRQLTRFFQWTNDVADRLAFSEVLSSDVVFSASMAETYSLLGLDPKDTSTLEKYLQEYFSNILKKLKDLKAQSKQGDFYI